MQFVLVWHTALYAVMTVFVHVAPAFARTTLMEVEVCYLFCVGFKKTFNMLLNYVF